MPPRARKRAKAGYMISAVAELYKLHPHTRLYTDSDLERLDVILTLARDMGVNLAGIEIILNMREKMVEMERQMTEFATVVQQELSRVASMRSQDKEPRHAIVRAAPRLSRTS
jgi:MerR family transcriptional regulator/heat shock protein HspR